MSVATRLPDRREKAPVAPLREWRRARQAARSYAGAGDVCATVLWPRLSAAGAVKARHWVGAARLEVVQGTFLAFMASLLCYRTPKTDLL